MPRKATLWAAFVVAAGLATSASAADLQVGIMVPTTGSEATYGKDMENAIKLAAEQINAKGGVLGMKVATNTQDAACDPQQAVNAASKLVSQGVTAVVGGYCSGATLPTLKIYGDAGVPIVIPAANSTKLIGAGSGNVFMINSTGNDQVITAVGFFKSKDIKTLAIVNEGDAYSADLASLTRDQWTKDGGKVVAYEVINKGEQDYSSLVTRIKSQNPDAVFWTAYYADGALLIKQLRQGGYKGMIALGDGNNSPKLFEIAGAAADGVYCFSNPTVEYLPGARAFAEAYKKQFNQAPGPYSALSYDGMNLLADAVKRAGSTDKPKIIAALKATKDFQGISGPISFTPQDTLARSNFVILVGKGKQWALYKAAS
ncbi:MAG: branched-chain amino acid ABC transporter substrate-binding protein [Acetobacteraceae bacterium]